MKSGWLLAGLLAATAAMGATAPALKITDAWVRWLPGDLPSAGYVAIGNPSATPTALLRADSPDYAMVMMHRSVRQNGVERMESAAAMPIPAHGSGALSPGGYHLMLMQPRHPIAPGAIVHITLHFSAGQTVDVPFVVRPPSALDSKH